MNWDRLTDVIYWCFVFFLFIRGWKVMKTYEFYQDACLSKEFLTDPDHEFVSWMKKSKKCMGYLCLIYFVGLFMAFVEPNGWIVAFILASEALISNYMVGPFSQAFKQLQKEKNK